MHEPCHTYEGVMFTNMNESRHTNEWFTSRIWMTPVKHMDESRHTHEWVMSHMWMSHVTHMNDSRQTYEWVTSHICISHVTHVNESRHTHECVPSHIWISHVTRMTARPNQSFMFPYWCVYFTIFFFTDSSVQILSSYRIWSSAQEYALLGLFLDIVESLVSAWPKWSGVNILYQACTSSERANRWGWPLNIFTWFIGAGRWVISRTHMNAPRRADEWVMSCVTEFLQMCDMNPSEMWNGSSCMCVRVVFFYVTETAESLRSWDFMTSEPTHCNKCL